MAGIPDEKLIKCSRGVNIQPDVALKDVSSNEYDVMVMPGGLGCAQTLCETAEVGKILKDQESKGKVIAAICAAPTALKAHKIGTPYSFNNKNLSTKCTEKYFFN